METDDLFQRKLMSFSLLFFPVALALLFIPLTVTVTKAKLLAKVVSLDTGTRLVARLARMVTWGKVGHT